MPTSTTTRSRVRRVNRAGTKSTSSLGDTVREKARRLKSRVTRPASRSTKLSRSTSPARRTRYDLARAGTTLAPIGGSGVSRSRTRTPTARRKLGTDTRVGAARKNSPARSRASKKLSRVRRRERADYDPRTLLE